MAAAANPLVYFAQQLADLNANIRVLTDTTVRQANLQQEEITAPVGSPDSILRQFDPGLQRVLRESRNKLSCSKCKNTVQKNASKSFGALDQHSHLSIR